MSTREWFDDEKGESIGVFTDEFIYPLDGGLELLCPRCGKIVTYVDFYIGDDSFGQPEYTSYLECEYCLISTGGKS
jgi:hypothetical protein